MSQNSWADIGEGIVGAFGMVLAFLTPMLRMRRIHWGLPREALDRQYPGDALIASPRWGWTHGIRIEAPPEQVWPWIAQVGQGRAGFYSYQWLENLAGCDLENADHIMEELAPLQVGDTFSLHPQMPPMHIVQVLPNRAFVAHAAFDLATGHTLEPGGPLPVKYGAISWLFALEPQSDGTTCFISRFRLCHSDDLPTRLSLGQGVLEPIGFVMDRRMLLGVKERVEGRTS